MTSITDLTCSGNGTDFRLRRSLSRGLAREAFDTAARRDGDMVSVLSAAGSATRNLRNRQRTAVRLGRLPGIVQVAACQEGLFVVLRTHRTMILKDEDGEQFREEVLMYTRVTFERTRQCQSMTMMRASFSRHAVERFVQRTDCGLRDLLPQIDMEALNVLRAGQAEATLFSGESAYRRSQRIGVWAGHPDQSDPGQHWPVSYRSPEDRRIPTFSVRTFLSPDEMSPTVWLSWQGDDTIAMAG